VPKWGNEDEDAGAVVVHEAGRLHAVQRWAPAAFHGAALSCIVVRTCSRWPIASTPDLKSGGEGGIVEVAEAG
jgi:hypothetical protein